MIFESGVTLHKINGQVCVEQRIERDPKYIIQTKIGQVFTETIRMYTITRNRNPSSGTPIHIFFLIVLRTFVWVTDIYIHAMHLR